MECPTCRALTPDGHPFCARCGASLAPPQPGFQSAPASPAGPAGAGAVADASTRFPPSRPDALESGSTFAGRYRVVEELGRGGMGRVYKVVDLEVHGKVALKLIRPEIALDPVAIDRFRQELTIARGISHKNVCRTHDLGRDGTTYFLTMEYVSGEDLKTMIGMSGQLGIGTAISIAKQVCDGLAEAHRLGVIHRDLKPQNIQIDKGGQAKIMDFGIARSVVAKGVTDGGLAVGTPQYMSPEQAEARGVDARTDLYALGVILYEMLTGRVPFDAETPLAVVLKHKLESPRDPQELNAAIPPDLALLVLKCLEKDAARRYQSAGEVHEDLVRIEQGLPTSAQVVPQPPVSTSKQITLPITARQLRLPALIAVALVAVALGAWRLWPRHAASEPAPGSKPTIAVLYFENISGDPTWRAGVPELLITSLSQSTLVNVVSSDSLFSILKRLNLVDAKKYSTEDLARVATESGAQYLLTGSVMKAGQSTIITVRLQNASRGETAGAPRRVVCNNDEEIAAKLDDLAGQVKGDLNLSAQALVRDSAQPLGQVLTSSPAALKHYTEARRLHLGGGCPMAIGLYQQAIDVDPAFAMAYRGLSSCYVTVGQPSKQAAAATRALELSDRLPDRFRYQIQITGYYTSKATYARAVEAANKLLATYPDDDIGLNYLGLIYCEAGEFEKCVEAREAAARVSPTLLQTSNLWAAYAQLGRDDDWKRSIERYLERDPNSAIGHAALARFYTAKARFDEAQRELDKALLLAPDNFTAHVIRGDVATLRGDFPAAEREYTSTLGQATEAQKRVASSRIVSLLLTQGRFEQAGDVARTSGSSPLLQGYLELETGRPLLAVRTLKNRVADPTVAPDPTADLPALWALGLASLASGDEAGARTTLDALGKYPEGVFGVLKTRMSLTLSGALAARHGDGQAAVTALERALSLLPHAYTGENSTRGTVLTLLAGAYEVAGDLARARSSYEAITTFTMDRLSWGETYARSFYRLGLIAEKQGDKAGARVQFQKFLDLWKDADKGLPEVADARKRMAADR
jgi:eukaryotic-like serine/threonine-protein kinase